MMAARNLNLPSSLLALTSEYLWNYGSKKIFFFFPLLWIIKSRSSGLWRHVVML